MECRHADPDEPDEPAGAAVTAAQLGADAASAPDVEPGLVARIGGTLRNAPPAAHTVTGPVREGGATHAMRPRPHTARLVAAACGAAAVVAAVGIGTAALSRSPGSAPSTLTSANQITVTARVPLSARQLSALVGRRPDFGALTDPKRRASCLNGLGYPSAQPILGARPLEVTGTPAIVLVLPGEHPDELIALAVAPNCSAIDTGLIANTSVKRP